MSIISKMKNRSPLNFVVFSSASNQVLCLLRRTIVASLLMGLIWSGFAVNSANASVNSVVIASRTESDRLSAFITCLPKQLSQPNFKRALAEMGYDQLERALDLKANPKLSEAETELASCLNRKKS